MLLKSNLWKLAEYLKSELISLAFLGLLVLPDILVILMKFLFHTTSMTFFGNEFPQCAITLLKNIYFLFQL